MYKNAPYRSQFWTDLHEIHTVGAGPLMGELIVLENNRPNRTTDIECVPKTSFFRLSATVWDFLKKKLKNCIRYPFSSPPPSKKKRLYSFLSSDALFSEKWSRPPKISFRRYFGKYCFFFWKNCSTPTKKGYIDFCRQTPSSPQNGHVLPQMGCFFRKTCSIIKHVIKNVVLIFCLRSPLSLKIGQCAPRTVFCSFLRKYCFFRKTYWPWKYLASNFL